jgi:hypothetical protein
VSRGEPFGEPFGELGGVPSGVVGIVIIITGMGIGRMVVTGMGMDMDVGRQARVWSGARTPSVAWRVCVGDGDGDGERRTVIGMARDVGMGSGTSPVTPTGLLRLLWL